MFFTRLLRRLDSQQQFPGSKRSRRMVRVPQVAGVRRSIIGKQKSSWLSRCFRFVIARHSPDRVLERGLPWEAPERNPRDESEPMGKLLSLVRLVTANMRKAGLFRIFRDQCSRVSLQSRLRGGEGGIRTPDTRQGMAAFEAARFNRSRTSPRETTRSLSMIAELAAITRALASGCRQSLRISFRLSLLAEERLHQIHATRRQHS